ncbi:RNA-directed DNA polymerase from mobile element jockey [Trichonephila clavipes]|nr:RNA-directed DNA polymerase from mobile element jockey [Trichonephila clavipes]
MLKKSPFAIQTALKGIGGDPKSVQKLLSGDLLIETASAVQSKSFLMAKTFLDSTLTVTSHKTLNCSRGVISESDILSPKLIDPQPSKTYAQVAKSITVNNSSQTDENITKIVCSPLKLISSLISDPKPTISSSVPAVNKSSTSTQAELVPSTSSVLVASPSKSQPPNSVIDTVPTASNSLSISAASSSSTACSVLETTTTISNTIPATSQNANQTSKPR